MSFPEQDRADLGRFGYAQELFRGMGGFSNFAISFSIISILTGAVTLFGFPLVGRPRIPYGFPLPPMKHFLKETDLGPGELGKVFSLARALKRGRGGESAPGPAGPPGGRPLAARAST